VVGAARAAARPPVHATPPPAVRRPVLRPSHLARLPSLFGLQHDEKDLFALVGPKGLQDYGDGSCQQKMTELSDALAVGPMDVAFSDCH